MKQSLFESLPQEITIEIMSRLPIDTIARCKCVCKAWWKLIDGSEFATLHRSKSTDPCIAYTHDDMMSPRPYKVCAFDVASSGTRAVSGFGFGYGDSYEGLRLHSSVDGLLLLVDDSLPSITLVICNPFTREYTRLPHIPPHYWDYGEYDMRILGFGASKVSGQYKVVALVDEGLFSDVFEPRSSCEVYDLGLGLWRNVDGDWSMLSSSYINGAAPVFFNGNLHFLGNDDDGLEAVSCFDLESELFTASFPAPRGYGGDRGRLRGLDGRLCLVDMSKKDEICIWFMNKYGDGNSWVKEYVVPLTLYDAGFWIPIKVFKDSGEILFKASHLFVYSNSTKAIRKYGLLQLYREYPEVVVFTPSFLSLKTMGIQDCDIGTF